MFSKRYKVRGSSAFLIQFTNLTLIIFNLAKPIYITSNHFKYLENPKIQSHISQCLLLISTRCWTQCPNRRPMAHQCHRPRVPPSSSPLLNSTGPTKVQKRMCTQSLLTSSNLGQNSVEGQYSRATCCKKSRTTKPPSATK